jgi:hypothetical protein
MRSLDLCISGTSLSDEGGEDSGEDRGEDSVDTDVDTRKLDLNFMRCAGELAPTSLSDSADFIGTTGTTSSISSAAIVNREVDLDEAETFEEFAAFFVLTLLRSTRRGRPILKFVGGGESTHRHPDQKYPALTAFVPLRSRSPHTPAPQCQLI